MFRANFHTSQANQQHPKSLGLELPFYSFAVQVILCLSREMGGCSDNSQRCRLLEDYTTQALHNAYAHRFVQVMLTFNEKFPPLFCVNRNYVSPSVPGSCSKLDNAARDRFLDNLEASWLQGRSCFLLIKTPTFKIPEETAYGYS
jgi:hypothetical protein